MLGDSDGVYNTLGVAISGNFEGYRAEGSVVVGAVYYAPFVATPYFGLGLICVVRNPKIRPSTTQIRPRPK